jgi:hypothetical protein
MERSVLFLKTVVSNVTAVNSGVIHGSVLGPNLFLIYINAITVACNDTVSIKLFADDVKLCSIIDFECCTISLQLSIDSLVSWASSWQLSINISNCNFLFLYAIDLIPVSIPYFVNEVRLINSSLVSDLGVLIDY